LQTDPGQNGFAIDGVLVVSESIMAEEVDMLPGDGRNALEQFLLVPM
jgi:hypothetical protein